MWLWPSDSKGFCDAASVQGVHAINLLLVLLDDETFGRSWLSVICKAVLELRDCPAKTFKGEK